MIRYYGLYRGVCVVRKDPFGKGRIRCFVPAVYGPGNPSPWCLACVHLIYPHKGVYYPPCIGEGVWIMFEQGDPRKPVWMGQWLGDQHALPGGDIHSCTENGN